jgi:hypothetical protein
MMAAFLSRRWFHDQFWWSIERIFSSGALLRESSWIAIRADDGFLIALNTFFETLPGVPASTASMFFTTAASSSI